MSFVVLCAAAILLGGLFGGAFVLMKKFAEWVVGDGPRGPRCV